MNQSIYPIGGSERELPVYVYGIGFNDWQFDIVRKEGYPHHQIIYCTRGEGRLVFDGKEYVISPNMCFLLPANYPHEYYTIGDLWETHWIAFNGTSADAILEKWNAEGLKSADEVADFEKKKKQGSVDESKSYDLDDFYEAALERSFKDLK